jgi:hypothetical protein
MAGGEVSGMHNRRWWLAVLVLSACTQVVEFDRSKIPDGDEDDGGMDAAIGDGDGGGDGDGDGDAGQDAEVDAYVPPACDVATHDGCTDTQLCCDRGDGNGANCVDVTFDECTQCNTAAAPEQGKCDVTVTVSCAARGVCECEAGSAAACSGSGAERFCASGTCVECMGSTDCTEAGKSQCVNGVCAGCNFAENRTGCSNPTPVCLEDNSCVACDDGSNACSNGLTCEDGGCYGCVVGSNEGCDEDGATPICAAADEGRFECVGCSQDSQCSGNPNGGQCVPLEDEKGSCETCDQRLGQNSEGCESTPAKPICVQPNGSSGTECVACTAVGVGSENDQACRDNDLGRACISSGVNAGKCGNCDPADNSGCSGTADQCHPTMLMCVDCVGNAGCAGGDVCKTGANVCVECNTNAECQDETVERQCNTSTNLCVECLTSAHCSGDEPICDTATNRCIPCTSAGDNNAADNAACDARTNNSVCVSTGASAGQCAACDPGDDDGCTNATLDQCSPTSLTCVDCVGGAGCGANRVCESGGNTCVECNTNTECADEATDKQCDTSTHACVQCLDDGDCSGSTPLCNTATNTCVACTAVSNDNDVRNSRCDADVDGTVCVTTGASSGQCRSCDPQDDDGCSGDTGQCNPANFLCVECVDSSQCSGAEPICGAGSRSCIPCTDVGDDTQNNAACAARSPGTVCVSTGASVGQCRTCDPQDDDGCGSTNDQCLSGTSSNTCVDCIGTDGCDTAAAPACGAANQCVECTGASHCADTPATPACSNNECVECASATDCADTPTTPACFENECVECTNATHCADTPATPECLAATNQCVECLNDADCSASSVGPECVAATNVCRACDPGPTASLLDDEGCMPLQACNSTTFVCE